MELTIVNLVGPDRYIMSILRKRGFTLIELLIVIAILGIIAVGLLAALDPLEQTRRASDASKRQLATDLMNALDRYYTQQQFPAFCADSTCGTVYLPDTPGVLVSAMDSNVSTNLSNIGESKSATAYTNHPQATRVYVSRDGSAPNYTAVLCWQPESKSQKSNVESRFTSSDGTGTCTPGSTANCFQCIRQ